MGEDGLAEVFAQVVYGMDLADAHGLEEFARAIPDAAMTGQGDFGGGSEADLGEVALQLLAVRAVYRARQVIRAVVGAIGAERIVGPDDAGKPAETDDALSARTLQQFVVDEPNLLVDAGSEQFGVVGLELEGVREEEIGLLGDQLVDRHLLHSEQDVTIAQVLLELDAGLGVFGIGDAPHIAGLDGQLDVRKAHQHFGALFGRQRDPLVRRHLSLPDDSNLHLFNSTGGKLDRGSHPRRWILRASARVLKNCDW